MVQLEQNAAEIEPMTGKFDPVPIDDYLAMIIASEMKDTKKGDGRYLNLTFEIIDGEYKGRRIFDTLNLSNPSEQTVEIARKRLSAIQRCVGVIHLRDSNEIHNIPLVITVGIKAADGQHDAKNVIRVFSRTDGKELKDVINEAPVAKAATASAPSAGKPLKPWQKQR